MDIARQVLNELADLPTEVLNQDVGLPEANTLFALATHLVGAAEFWVLSLAAGCRLHRAAEFVTSGTYDDLERRYSAWLLAMDELFSPRSSDELDHRVELPADQGDTLGNQAPTVRACVLHAIELSALHLVHIQLTRTLLTGVNK